ncbi:spermidine synthase [Pyrococcus kukulkanii]|uniref:spermine/spermidine synthase domain-containing protein n=1 Tax=Pyrococcus kukulkanii TaxID=1609559 RepID=UPI0035695E23
MTFVYYISKYKDYFEAIPLNKIYFYGKTKYQTVLIAHSPLIKHFLVLDGKIQSSEIDEFIYHEALVHPAMITHPNPEKILLLGGGEGSPVKEILKHPSVKHVDWVDIDGELVELCRKYLPYSWKGNDPRVSFYAMDGFEFIEMAIEEGRKYDIVIFDLVDASEDIEIANHLYSKETSEKVYEILKEDGIFVQMAYEKVNGKWKKSAEYLRDIFPILRYYGTFVPSFDTYVLFSFASKRIDPIKLNKDIIKQKLSIIRDLRFYNYLRHYVMFTNL